MCNNGYLALAVGILCQQLLLCQSLSTPSLVQNPTITATPMKQDDSSTNSVIGMAKRYFSLGNQVKQQLGPTNSDDLRRELSDEFEFVAPLVGPLGKDALMSATKGVDFTEGLPDFDARYHDFRVDPDDARRVWCTMRVTGTHTGTFRFGATTAEPRSPPVRVESPPEAVSLRFDDEGRVREITTGYPLDRRVGNTNGLGGIFGLLEGLGYPLPVFLTRTTGEVLSPLLRAVGMAPPPPEEGLLRVPQPSTVLPADELMRLTNQLLQSNFGTELPNLLADSFTFSGPVVGPLTKDDFLSAFGAFNLDEAFPDLDYQYRDMRVCPYDTNRVWYTSSPTGTHTRTLRLGRDVSHSPTGKTWISPPECGSMQFDEHGKCVSLTGGYVMDRRMGNTNGIGGVFGICEALGLSSPLPVFLLYTPVQNVERAKKFWTEGYTRGFGA